MTAAPLVVFALVVQRVTFPEQYRRLCMMSRLGVASLLCVALLWLITAWGGALSIAAWWVVGTLVLAAGVPLMWNRSPLGMELMWRSRLKADGEPGQPIWLVRLVMPQAIRNAQLLWCLAIGDRVLILGVAESGWCPQIFVLIPPWFAVKLLRRMRISLRLGPPPAACRALGVSQGNATVDVTNIQGDTLQVKNP